MAATTPHVTSHFLDQDEITFLKGMLLLQHSSDALTIFLKCLDDSSLATFIAHTQPDREALTTLQDSYQEPLRHSLQ